MTFTKNNPPKLSNFVIHATGIQRTKQNTAITDSQSYSQPTSVPSAPPITPSPKIPRVFLSPSILARKMCLAIAMYLVTGTLSLLWQIAMALGIFLLNLLGRVILFVCASVYTVARPVSRRPAEPSTTVPFVTMYPELYDFGEDLDAMARMSLETVTSAGDGESPRPASSRAEGSSGVEEEEEEDRAGMRPARRHSG